MGKFSLVVGVIVVLIVLVLLGLHLSPLTIQIDGIVIGLLVIALIAPYIGGIISRITGIKTPWGEVAFADQAKKAAKKAINEEKKRKERTRLEQRIDALAKAGQRPAQIEMTVPTGVSALEKSLESDPKQALIELGAELERRLATLAQFLPPVAGGTRPEGVIKLSQELLEGGIITPRLFGEIRTLYSLRNRAIHGEGIKAEEMSGIVDASFDVLEILDHKALEVKKLWEQKAV